MPSGIRARCGGVTVHEHAFAAKMAGMGNAGTAHGRFTRAVHGGHVFAAELAARELGRVGLEDALELVLLYARADPVKFDRAAARWLGRFALERDTGLLELGVAISVLGAVGRLDPDARAMLRRLIDRPNAQRR
jgi:hypothetical protein